MIPHILTENTLMFSDPINGRPPRQVEKDHRNYAEIYKLVAFGPNNDEAWDRIGVLMTPLNHLREILAGTREYGTVRLEFSENFGVHCVIAGHIFHLPKHLATYILDLYADGGDIEPLARFIELLAENPRREVINELWGFLSACGLCLTADGHFLAYKNVNTDFTSVYDNKTDNSPGTVLSMRRSDVEHNPDRTCSHGLHFAAWGYLQHYAPGRKTVLLKISPADVVSIPTDYNNMKGRACAYTVLREVEQPEELKNMVLYREHCDEEYEEWEDDDSSYNDGEYECPECGAFVHIDDDECPNCGHYL